MFEGQVWNVSFLFLFLYGSHQKHADNLLIRVEIITEKDLSFSPPLIPSLHLDTSAPFVSLYMNHNNQHEQHIGIRTPGKKREEVGG